MTKDFTLILISSVLSLILGAALFIGFYSPPQEKTQPRAGIILDKVCNNKINDAVTAVKNKCRAGITEISRSMLPISQDCNKPRSCPFQIVYELPDRMEVVLPLTFYQGDYRVDWGDGSETSNLLSHQYTNGGTYTIKVYGPVSQILYKEPPPPQPINPRDDWMRNIQRGFEPPEMTEKPSHEYIRRILSYGNSNITTIRFKHMTNLIQIPPLLPSSVTDCSYMFYGICDRDVKKDISNWNVGNVKNMESMFADCRQIKEDISRWDVRNVTNMKNMFKDCREFSQDISNWRVDNVENMEGMFDTCQYFGIDTNNIDAKIPLTIDLSKWNVGRVKNMKRMFCSCEHFNPPVSTWNVENVENMEGLFKACKLFDQDLSKWNVSKVTDMGAMFYCFDPSPFNQDLSSWNVKNVTNMTYMFANCVLFNQDLSSWNVSKVTNMSYMFYDCKSFNSRLAIWNVGEVRDMTGMFSGCTSFNQYIGEWNVSNVESMNSMFSGCSNFNNGEQPGESNRTLNWTVRWVRPRSMTRMFHSSSFSQDLSNWYFMDGKPRPEDVMGMFANSGITENRVRSWAKKDENGVWNSWYNFITDYPSSTGPGDSGSRTPWTWIFLN